MPKLGLKIIFVASLIGIALFGLFKNFIAQAQNDTGNIKDAIQNGAFSVDVRTPEEFAAGSVKGAVNIPLDKIESNLDQFKDKSHIVVFCKSGNRSGQAKRILEKNGITSVTNGGSWLQVKKVVEEK